MKNQLMEMEDKFMLSKRGIIKSVNGILKETCQIEHSRHRSPINFFVNQISGLVAYSFLPKQSQLLLLEPKTKYTVFKYVASVEDQLDHYSAPDKKNLIATLKLLY